MGWRISLYRLPKQTADKWKNITEEQYHKDEDKLYNDLTSECIFYDTLTDIICEDRDKKLHSDFFINDINTNESAFITISKEQFLRIIEEVRQRIIYWFDGRKVDKDGELGEYWKNPFVSLYIKCNAPWTADSAMKENQKEWNDKAYKWKTTFKDTDLNGEQRTVYLNIDLRSKWKVSGGSSYEYLIFDLIHIYKIFDWDNDVLLAIGG